MYVFRRLDEHPQFRVIIPRVQVLQTGVRIEALADEPLGLGQGCRIARFVADALEILGTNDLPPRVAVAAVRGELYGGVGG